MVVWQRFGHGVGQAEGGDRFGVLVRRCSSNSRFPVGAFPHPQYFRYLTTYEDVRAGYGDYYLSDRPRENTIDNSRRQTAGNI